MKPYIYFILIFSFITISSCSKPDECENPIDCLPQITQIGAQTFGCLINNEPFKPGGSQLSGPTLQIDYTLIDGQYIFNLSGDNKESNKAIVISIRGEELQENTTYTLSKYERDSNFGEYLKSGSDHRTDSIHTGELHISQLDLVDGIVSGTFWFDAINDNNEIVEIREGRFDIKL